MSENVITWVSRIFAVIIYAIFIFLCEEFKLRPAVCFLLSCFCIVGMAVFFEAVDGKLK